MSQALVSPAVAGWPRLYRLAVPIGTVAAATMLTLHKIILDMTYLAVAVHIPNFDSIVVIESIGSLAETTNGD